MSEQLEIMEEKRQEIVCILEKWGLIGELAIKEEYEGHVWTINENYILKMTHDEGEVKNNLSIAYWLDKVGIPTQNVIKTIANECYVRSTEGYYVLFTKLKGDVLRDYFEGDYLERAVYLGECLASLHEGLKVITEEVKCHQKLWDNQMNDELAGWVEDELNQYLFHSQLPKEELEHFNLIKAKNGQTFNALYVNLPRQVIHRDFQGGNLIFHENHLVGYIDFDLSQINARLFDVCYLCTGALASAFNVPETRKKWVSFVQSVIKGYESKLIMTSDEQRSIKEMMIAIELIMIAYFAREGNAQIADLNIQMVNWIDSVW